MKRGKRRRLTFRPPPSSFRLASSVCQRVQGLLETVGVRALRLGKGFEPVGYLVEAFVAGTLGHTGVHVGVLMGLAGNRGFQVIARLADRQPGRRVAHGFEVLEMPMRVTGFTLGGGAENRRDIVLALDRKSTRLNSSHM